MPGPRSGSVSWGDDRDPRGRVDGRPDAGCGHQHCTNNLIQPLAIDRADKSVAHSRWLESAVPDLIHRSIAAANRVGRR